MIDGWLMIDDWWLMVDWLTDWSTELWLVVIVHIFWCIVRIGHIGDKKLLLVPPSGAYFTPHTTRYKENWYFTTILTTEAPYTAQSLCEICACWLHYSSEHRGIGRYKVWWSYLQGHLGKHALLVEVTIKTHKSFLDTVCANIWLGAKIRVYVIRALVCGIVWVFGEHKK